MPDPAGSVAAVIATPDLASMLQGGDLLSLGAQAARPGPAGYREDGAVLLVDGEEEREPTHPPEGSARRPRSQVREVHVVRGSVEAARARHPRAWIHAAQPGGDSLCLFTGRVEEPTGPWERWVDLPGPKVAAAVYGPDSPPEALAVRLQRLRAVRDLRSVVWLPDYPGDMLFLQGRTTDGTEDAVVLAVTRLALPPAVHVRASWAAYGWKLAQVALTFGADEVAGWGLEEELAWGAQAEPASVVSREEAEAGIAEALREPVEVRGCAWES